MSAFAMNKNTVKKCKRTEELVIEQKASNILLVLAALGTTLLYPDYMFIIIAKSRIVQVTFLTWWKWTTQKNLVTNMNKINVYN